MTQIQSDTTKGERFPLRKDVFRRGLEALGYDPLLTPENSSLQELSVGRLRLEADAEPYKGTTGACETLLQVLVGQCSVEAQGPWGQCVIRDAGERRDVFSGAPTTVVLQPGTSYSVVPTARTVDVAVASAPVDPSLALPPTVVRPQDVRVHTIGEEHYVRTVREVIGGDGPATRLRAGETINPVGRWSSWPHHDFDANPDNAPLFEEVFLYFTKPGRGWGVQRRSGLYSDLSEVDDVIVVKNGDAAVLPLGEHPVVAGVDSELLYVWFYFSPIPKVYARWAEDVGGYA
ncbi:MAG TPA: 5-deoxy-glucuronate isomerase [Solirubrobacteraceae bacterium]|nr:5-deoxy-glucuronate isomerase [Solirubrobacteraceae bacterium]